jgi:ABC-2 type transport system permease protein
MDKFWTVFKTEYAQIVKKKSFLVGVFLTPLFIGILMFVPALLADKGIESPQAYSIIDADGRGLGQRFAKALQRYKLDNDTLTQAYALENIYTVDANDLARIDSLRVHLDSLLQNKQLKYYVIIGPRPEKTDSVLLVSRSTNFKTAARFDNRISDILSSVRLENSNINLPVDSILTLTRRIDMQQLSPGGKSRDFLTLYFTGLVFVMIIFMTVISYGQVLMRSIIEEKSSRIVEVLVSSLSPSQLMYGKILGLGAANLTQVAIWVAVGLAIFLFKGPANVPTEIIGTVFNPIYVGFFVLYLLIAYLMFSTMFAFIGSICTTDKEAQNFIFPITMSLILPIIINMSIIQDPDSTLAVVLSLIPIFTPTIMVLRLTYANLDIFSFSEPIIAQATLGLVISAVFTAFVIWLSAKVFRMGILMYGKRATLPEIVKWVRHR